MFVSLRIITLPPHRLSERDAIIAELRASAEGLPGISSVWIAPVIERVVFNAGHIVWRMELATEGAANALPLNPVWRARIQPLLADTQMTAIGYRVTRAQVHPAGSGIWRALIFRVVPPGFPEKAAALEAGLLLFPKYIPAIRSWALSPVATVEGPKAFTHVWEQEFDNISGLTGDYMTHPIHWGFADAWFDAESPDYIVDPQLIQVAGEIGQTIMNQTIRGIE